MPNGSAAPRSQNFYEGSESVRQPQFKTIQQVPGTYRRTSTLDNLYPTGNGMDDQGRQRQMMGISSSAIGQSSDSFEKSIWLRNPEQPTLYNKTFG